MDLSLITVQDFKDLFFGISYCGVRVTKFCRKCSQTKRITEFHNEYSKRDKLSTVCKECKAKYRGKHVNKIRQIMHNINKRCSAKYHGINNFLSISDIEYLWNRDSAELLKTPSIDRINNDGDYIISNCRFIEHSENSKKDKYKSVKQLSLDGNIIMLFPSIQEANLKTGVCASHIGMACSGKTSTAGGYKWRFNK